MNLSTHESISELTTLASVRANYAYDQYDKLMGITQYESIILYELFPPACHKKSSSIEAASPSNPSARESAIWLSSATWKSALLTRTSGSSTAP